MDFRTTYRALVSESGSLNVKTFPTPRLTSSQIRVAPLAVGICRDDILLHQDPEARPAAFGAPRGASWPGGMILGHEFTAKVLEVGTAVEEWAPGDVLVALPEAVDRSGVNFLQCQPPFVGGLAETAILGATGHLRVPPKGTPLISALTLPVSAGIAAVTRTRLQPGAGAIVLGCGALGLGTVTELARRGIAPIVVADPSPARSEVALECGAHSSVDPRTGLSVVDEWRTLAAKSQELVVFDSHGASEVLDLLVKSRREFTFVPVGGPPSRGEQRSSPGRPSGSWSVESCGALYHRIDIHDSHTALLRLASGAIRCDQLITTINGIDNASAAFDLDSSHYGSDDVIMVMICPQRSS